MACRSKNLGNAYAGIAVIQPPSCNAPRITRKHILEIVKACEQIAAAQSKLVWFLATLAFSSLVRLRFYIFLKSRRDLESHHSA